MSDAKVRSAKELFLAARELDASSVDAFLSEACAHDAALLNRVRGLIKAEAALGPGVFTPAPAVAPIGEELERYELLDVIGEGGHGTVYRAKRRGGLQQHVAIKVLRGGLDSGEALARFRIEQTALELLDHPAIAKVLDAGVSTLGRPYIVMDLVEGDAITALCDRLTMSVQGRLRCVIQICQAVQHAHARGIIHRDLKPSNVLGYQRTDGQAPGDLVIKIIDFGIAKLAAHADGGGGPSITSPVAPLGTPAYMSPELARGRAAEVDARSDVYSLGALAYELLCGLPVVDVDAMRRSTPAEIERMICDTSPPALWARAEASGQAEMLAGLRQTDVTTLRRMLRGPLNWVLMRALEKDPVRRYPTADAMRADLERLLRDEPVEAAPPSVSYRLLCGYRRNRAVAIAAGIALASLVAGSTWAIIEAGRAKRAEIAAREQSRVAQAMSDFLRQDMLGSLEPSAMASGSGGRDVGMREVMDKASARLGVAGGQGGALQDQPLVLAGLHTTFASTYLSLGRFGDAERHAHSAVDAARSAEVVPGNTTCQAHIELARALMAAGTMQEAIESAQTAVQFAQSSPRVSQNVRGDARIFLGIALTNSDRDISRARSLFDAEYRDRVDRLGSDHPSTLFAGYLLAHAMLKMEDIDAAESLQQKVLDARTQVLGPKHPDTLWSRLEIARAKVHRDKGASPATRNEFEEIIRLRTEVLGPDHYDTMDTIEELANFHVRDRRLSEARRMLEPLYAQWRRIGGDDHARTIRAASVLGEVLARQGDFEHAMPLLVDSVERLNRTAADAHYDAAWIRWRLDAAKRAQASGIWQD